MDSQIIADQGFFFFDLSKNLQDITVFGQSQLYQQGRRPPTHVGREERDFKAPQFLISQGFL